LNDPWGWLYDPGSFCVLNITEDHRRWPDVKRFFAKYGNALDQINNVFTKREMEAAEWLKVHALGHHGYPQPEDDFWFRDRTYDLTDACLTKGYQLHSGWTPTVHRGGAGAPPSELCSRTIFRRDERLLVRASPRAVAFQESVDRAQPESA